MGLVLAQISSLIIYSVISVDAISVDIETLCAQQYVLDMYGEMVNILANYSLVGLNVHDLTIP